MFYFVIYLLCSNTKLRAFYGKWVEALFTYDVEVWEEYVKASAGSGASAISSRPSKVCVASLNYICTVISRETTQVEKLSKVGHSPYTLSTLFIF